MTAKITRFLEEVRPVTPCVVVDLDVVRDNYLGLRRWLPLADVYYAVKANPAPEIVRMLAALGSNFDVASRGEIDLCLANGVFAENISFGNTIKKQRDIAYAYEKGVRLYAFDCEAELEKLAESAPGARVFCRILMTCDGAEWPLSRKFGCEIDMARDLLVRARDLGLDPYGVSFHVGSQQTDLNQWDIAVGKAAMLFTALDSAGIDLRMVNLGGGFPARYRSDIPAVERYADAVMSAMTNHFGNNIPAMIIEPGRSLVGDAGILETEVVLISRKGYDDDTRWVYLDVGKFGGLAETMDEAIKYRIQTSRDGDDTAPVVLAGPTCDSADILYEKSNYEMPVSLKVGDKVRILSTGAYTTSYSAVNFNGFDPLKAYFI
ncbi:type III PLP-dependent enzyme [Magnetospirillum fulvum]|uniref:ornithine decarboxylase n=1 Tax=Magnetospirillum fulvum TaxID=1082 RepID=A0A1H6HFY7_MAGFU|nr:type III PLP-dependent enzyme [Magnetospirillum fulvum]SEH34366.1 ornithine decarboxylase [Magnetospirillum fulvum]